ncbi:MAG: hypothetical protein ACE5JD_03035, partial [Candidatus Methylomirabilia bacterium]
SWYRFTKKYVWNEEKTPYFVGVDKLTRVQAKNEMFVYTLFLATVFAVITIASVAGIKLGGSYISVLVALYAFSVCCAAIFFGVTKNLRAARYCVAAPVAAFLSINGLRPDLATIDRYVLLAFSLIWLRYAVRVVAIAKAFHRMPAEIPQG